MYRAELHGKLSRDVREAEDILTSNVFSFYLYADRVHLRHLLLECAELQVTRQEAEDAEFQFWPAFHDGTEPDLVIQVGSYYVLVEAKLHSGYGEQKDDEERHQLLREVRAGRREATACGRQFIFLTITDETIPHDLAYGRLQGADRAVWLWTNWSRITRALETGPPVGRMGQDLLALLRRKGLRRFDGFTGEGERIHASRDRFFFHVQSANLGRFAGFGDLLGPLLLTDQLRPLFFASEILPVSRRRGRS